MNRLKKSRLFWERLTFIGVHESFSIDETIKTRLLNIVLFIAFSLLSILWVRSIIVHEMGQFSVISIVFFLIVGIFRLNTTGRQKIARLIIIFGISLAMTAILILLHPSPWELEYIFLMVIFVNLIFFQGRTQFLLLLFITGLFITAHIVEPILPMEYKILIPLTPNLPIFLFIFFVFYSSVILTFYQLEIKKYQNAKKDTIDKLQNSNIKLKFVSKELEQFIYIVSSDLKSRLQKISKHIQSIRSNTNQLNYSNIKDSLEATQNMAYQMHFWVNDILEFSTVNKSGKRSEEIISFDELFKNISDNLSGDIYNFENRFVWIAIPNVRLNKLEVFIVFSNLLRIAFESNNTKTHIKTTTTTTNDYLSIQFMASKNHSPIAQQETLTYKIQLCQLIVKGWNGEMQIKNINNNKVYEINIPKNKLV